MVLSCRGNAKQSWNGLKGASGQVVVTHGSQVGALHVPVCPVVASQRMAVEVRYFPARRGKEVTAGQSRNGTARLVGLSQGKAVGEG